MQYFLDSMIYLLAILGIILTTITFLEMLIQKRTIQNSYRIFHKNNENNKNIEVVIHIENLSEEEEKNLVKKINENQEIKIREIANSIVIQKEK